jgi:type VI secretion system protein ImpL
MKKLLGLIFNRTVMTILGLIALSLIVWFVGPLIAIADFHPLDSESVRWIIIGLIFGIFLLRLLWKFIKAKTNNARLFDGLLKQNAPQAAANDAGTAEVALLGQRFEEAVAVLKQANVGATGKKSSWFSRLRRQYIYELPWYIIIGAPGSGKTTALINSGLKFPLADTIGSPTIRGVGGTRNCDWWFTDEAVMIDTAGRYTTQESNQKVDAAAWGGFLQLLKKFRPRRPINGALLTISVEDLLQQNAAERDAQATALRKRLQELHQQLAIRFPVYVLITKADLLAGFMEFFGDLGSEDRAQVWGMSFPYGEEIQGAAPTSSFTTELATLEHQLNARLVDRMQQERDPQRRALLYLFPQQFASIGSTLNDFLDKVFAPSRFEEKPLLRGVYLTSGTQEGNPIDRVMGTLGRAFRLERKLLEPLVPSGKSFFITRLLREVIFHEAGLAGTNLKWERRRRLLQWGGLVAAAFLTVAATVAWTVSYSRNRAYVADVESRVQGISKQLNTLTVGGNADIVSLLPVFQSVHDLAESSATGGTVPTSMQFGLYQGDKLTAASRVAHQRLLQDTFLPRLALRLEEQLAALQGNPEALYETLKAYVMLYDPEHFDPDALRTYVHIDWESNLPRDVTVEQRAVLFAQLDTLLAAGQIENPIVPNTQLVSSARAIIARTPIERRIYNRIRQEGVGSEFPDFSIAKVAGANAGLVFRRASGKPLTDGVPGLFSYKGYYNAFIKTADRTTKELVSEESWVLGIEDNQRNRFVNPEAKTQLINDVRRLYLEDYARTWENFVNDIRVETGTERRQAIQAASILSAPDTPLPRLLRAIVTEVTLVKKPPGDMSIPEKVEDQLQGNVDRVRRILGANKPRTTAELATTPERIVDDRFDNLRRLVTPAAPGQPAPIDGQIALLQELAQAMLTADAAIKANNPPPASGAPDKAMLQAAQVSEPMQTILKTLADYAARLIAIGTKENVSGELMQISEFCNKAITGRYPFVRGSTRDVTTDDFAKLFATGGDLDRFFQAKLLPIVDISKKPWTYRQVGDARQTDTSGTLLQFQRAQTIRDVFFRAGGSPNLRLEFKPLEMDATITQFILDVDGQLVRYSHGPLIPQAVQWPGPSGSTQVRLQVSPPGAAGGVPPFEGPWALFRLFDRMKLDSTSQPEKFRVTFDVDGRKALFEVSTSSVQNPFRLPELQQFQCPGRL